MIAQLTGKIAHKSADSLIVDVGGVGYELHVPATTSSRLREEGSPVTLHVYTHVREDQLSLYGFIDAEDKDIFLRLIKINGIGPKLALSILSGIDGAELSAAIASSDASRLQLIPGIGKKTAERIIIELKDKIDVAKHVVPKTKEGIYCDALSALVNLGYPRAKAMEALRKAPWKDDASLEDMIKLALKELS